MSDAIQSLLHEHVEALRYAPRQRGREGLPPLIGVAGAQGSGKSYQSKRFAAQSGGRVAHFSLDDVYHPRSFRAYLARRATPLLITRGPPGTHNLALAKRTIALLGQAGIATTTPIPAFDKRTDDPAPEQDSPKFIGRPDLILMDGWCLGARYPETVPGEPLNALEEEDVGGAWRAYTLAQLKQEYVPFFMRFDAFIYLRAPSWEVVRRWRGEQEVETLGRPLAPEEEQALDRFVQHYERITRAMFDGRHYAQSIVHLDESRRVVSIERRE